MVKIGFISVIIRPQLISQDSSQAQLSPTRCGRHLPCAMSDVRFELSVALQTVVVAAPQLIFLLHSPSRLTHFFPSPPLHLHLVTLTLLAWLFAAVVVGGPTTNSRRCVCVRRVQTLILLFSNKNHTTNALLMLSSRPVYTLSSAARTGSATANPREVHSSEDVISSLSSGSCVSTSGYTHNTSLPW